MNRVPSHLSNFWSVKLVNHRKLSSPLNKPSKISTGFHSKREADNSFLWGDLNPATWADSETVLQTQLVNICEYRQDTKSGVGEFAPRYQPALGWWCPLVAASGTVGF